MSVDYHLIATSAFGIESVTARDCQIWACGKSRRQTDGLILSEMHGI